MLNPLARFQPRYLPFTVLLVSSPVLNPLVKDDFLTLRLLLPYARNPEARITDGLLSLVLRISILTAIVRQSNASNNQCALSPAATVLASSYQDT
ncbi:hypothetical protein D9756_010746 [Leucocoprinus leucothites]|uniref:Uncharacterized protein n=1 Tax=Leucocoprinus leucothites TaxID=201217 RepID=A0A8H5CUF6_9AGAR|nr:hypothetical protein D9756_010746 [Leucoagaricus leucothites]